MSDLKTILSNCDAKRDHNYRLGADNFTITTAEYHALREAALNSARPEEGRTLAERNAAVQVLTEIRGALPPWLGEYKRITAFLASLEPQRERPEPKYSFKFDSPDAASNEVKK